VACMSRVTADRHGVELRHQVCRIRRWEKLTSQSLLRTPIVFMR
jgi:hypothetical protein